MKLVSVLISVFVMIVSVIVITAVMGNRKVREDEYPLGI